MSKPASKPNRVAFVGENFRLVDGTRFGKRQIIIEQVDGLDSMKEKRWSVVTEATYDLMQEMAEAIVTYADTGHKLP